jgi:uncharacterized repeat protein (TIGR02543 family)/LPXTG-motif cell wall-anchored protein
MTDLPAPAAVQPARPLGRSMGRRAVRGVLSVLLVPALAFAGVVAGPATSASAAAPSDINALQTAFNAGGIVRLGGDITGGHLVVPPNGDVTLMLDGHKLTVQGSVFEAGVGVAQGAVFVLEEGVTPPGGEVGTLTATGSEHGGAGIGGATLEAAGTVIINGGTINATGERGAGIGAGAQGTIAGVTINGGYVTATSTNGGAGIGSAFYDPALGTAGPIIITGGTVVASGSRAGAGVGSGAQSRTGDVIITGGTLTASGQGVNHDGLGGAGIGSGGGGFASGSGVPYAGVGTISITGGTVNALGGALSPGIGAGYRGVSGEIQIGVDARVSAFTDAAQASAVGAGEDTASPVVSNAGILTIEAGSTLRVPDGSALANSGIIRGAVTGTVTGNSFPLSFDPQGGAPTPAAFRVYAPTLADALLSVPAAPTRTGHEFLGWMPAAGGPGAQLGASTALGTAPANWFARWNELEQHDVVFDSAGGSPIETQQVYQGTAITEPATPTRTGYAFGGWFETGADTAWTFDTPVTGPVALTARWAVNSYAVTIDRGDGSAVESRSVAHGTAIVRPENPVRTGSVFAGWVTAGAERWDFDTPVTGPVALAAEWVVASYRVAFNSAGGSDVDAQIVDHGTVIIEPMLPSRTGYDFDGWFAPGEATAWDFDTPITAAVELTASWTRIFYPVTLDRGDGSAVENRLVAHGFTMTQPALPSRTGYIFGGWFAADADAEWLFDTPVTGPVALSARWTANSYPVTIDRRDGSAVESRTVDHGTAIVEPAAPARTGYGFGGWFAEGADTVWSFGTLVTGPVDLTARWTLNEYAVTLDRGDGSAVETRAVDHGTAIVEPADPVRTGHTFVGWFAAGADAAWNFDTRVTGPVALTARWTLDSYLVEFDSAGGSAVAAQTLDHGALVVRPGDPERAGHDFLGWFSARSGGSEWAFSAAVLAPTTLHARWAAHTAVSLAVMPDAAAVAIGTSVTVTASVSPATARGTIELFDGSTSLGHGTLSGGVFRLAGTTFSVTTSTLDAGAHSLSAVFTPADGTFVGARSGAVALLVNALQPQGPAPAADGDELLEGAENNDWPVLPDTDSVSWAEPTDSFVDVFLYDPQTPLGTLPVADGVIDRDGLTLPELAPGEYLLAFVGQTTGAVTIVRFTVAAPPVVPPVTPPVAPPVVPPVSQPTAPTGIAAGTADEALAATGMDSSPALLFGGILLLAGAWLLRRRRGPRRAA